MQELISPVWDVLRLHVSVTFAHVQGYLEIQNVLPAKLTIHVIAIDV